MRSLTFGILAHVDAGKTSLTERLLHTAGVIGELGSVDRGSTHTDSMELERQRGITIKSAVVSFTVNDVTLNLIDTPGHPDFIAEVERVLTVLDGAVLVVSAVEGVQAQTRILMRALRRMRIPTLIFVNKIDRRGAREVELLPDIADKLTPASIPMCTVDGLGGGSATTRPHGAHDATFVERLADLLADNDDGFLASYVDSDGTVPYPRMRVELAGQTRRADAHPVFFGSAMTGAGVTALLDAVTEFLPASEADVDGPVSGTVFKVERGRAGEKIAYVRLFSGTVHTRDRLPTRQLTSGKEAVAKVTAISVFDNGDAARLTSLPAGRIGQLWGLSDVGIGDVVGEPPKANGDRRQFSPPTLETVILPRRPSDLGPLHDALSQLAEQDPLINLRQDAVRQETFISLYGEVQKEVIQATLADEFGVEVEFRETTTICVERPVGTGSALEVIDKEPNPFLATVGLRVEPAPIEAGVEFRLGIELGSLPLAFIKAVEETVLATLAEGLYGWQVLGCTVTLAQSGYWSRQSHSHGTFDASMSSTAGDFRNLTPLVLMAALKKARTAVYEPIHRYNLEIPPDAMGVIQPVLVRLRAVPLHSEARGSSYVLEGDIPAAQVNHLERRLPSLTHGEGVIETVFDHYKEIRGSSPPVRPRTDHNPLDRREYLLKVSRRMG